MTQPRWSFWDSFSSRFGSIGWTLWSWHGRLKHSLQHARQAAIRIRFPPNPLWVWQYLLWITGKNLRGLGSLDKLSFDIGRRCISVLNCLLAAAARDYLNPMWRGAERNSVTLTIKMLMRSWGWRWLKPRRRKGNPLVVTDLSTFKLLILTAAKGGCLKFTPASWIFVHLELNRHQNII